MTPTILKYCAVRGCGAKVAVPTDRCPQHARDPWTPATRAKPARIRGRRLQQLRVQLFTAQPLCVACRAQGRIVLATIRDHIIPLAEGGQDTVANTQALCQACSDLKTQAEARRGQHRS